VKNIFENFIENCSDSVMRRCTDDLTALTRYVTWDLSERSSGALKRSLPDQSDIVSVYQVALKSSTEDGASSADAPKAEEKSQGVVARASPSSALTAAEPERDYHNLLQLMEEAACARDANRTNLVVSGLVQHIVSQWRESFGKTVSTKCVCPRRPSSSPL
jgi:hypothetical protein